MTFGTKNVFTPRSRSKRALAHVFARVFARLFLAVLAVTLSFIVNARVASAAGSVTAQSTTLKEEDGRWKMTLTIDYGGTPELQFIPMNFHFEQVVLYERALTDEGGDKPVLTKKQLSNQTPKIESMDVGFSDGTGKVFKKTKFNFVIRRDREFEAGEYMVTVKKADGNQQIGRKFRIILNGDNPVINRKSITFVDDKGKDSTDPTKVKSKSDPSAYKDSGDSDASSDSSGSSDSSSDSDASAEPPPAVEPKQGGCGCRVAGERSVGSAAGLGALALAGIALLRRRRRASERAVSERAVS